MIATIIVDTGPLVAMLDRRDQHHEWTLAQLGSLKEPLATCEAVLCEATFLLRKRPHVIQTLFDFLHRGEVVLAFHLQPELPRVWQLMQRYRDLPMSLADACLVRMAELFAASRVFTLDSDFRIYRKHGRQVIPTLLPEI